MPQLLGVAWALEWKLRILAGYQVYHQVGPRAAWLVGTYLAGT